MKRNNCFVYPKTVRESIEGVRHYDVGKEKLPSVTTILKATESEEKKLRRVLSMETNDEQPEALFSGLYTRVEQHLDEINRLQNRIVVLQEIADPE